MGVFEKIVSAPFLGAAEGIANIIDRFVETADEKASAEVIKQRILARPREAQIEINKIEAAHRSILVAGWRPFIGWVCGVCLGLHYVPQYVLAAFLWGRQVIRADELVPYPVGADGLTELVLALLGMGMLRSVEKLGGRAK